MAPDERATSLEELYEYLKKFSLSDALLIIGVVNDVLKYGPNKLNEIDTPPVAVAWIKESFPDDKEKTALMLRLTRMARFLILSGANDYKKEIIDTGTVEMNNALYLTATLFDKELDKVEFETDLPRAFGRISQWQFPLLADSGALLGRGYLLFIQIPEEISTRYNFNEKMKEHFGIDMFQFLATGLALWIISHGVLKRNMSIEVEALKNVVTPKSLDKFVELSSGTQEDYRRMVRGDDFNVVNKLRDNYVLDPFFQMPAIKVKRSFKVETGEFIVPQPLYLIHRASLGAFYLLGDKEKELALAMGKAGKNDFRECFGDVYKVYVGKQLDLCEEPLIFIDLDKEMPAEMKKPDFAIIDDDCCLLFEIKIGMMPVDTRTFIDEQTAKIEIEKDTGNFKKGFEQLCIFEDLILSQKTNDIRFNKINKVVNVLVAFEDTYLANAFLLPLARQKYGERTKNLQLASLSDIEAIGSSLARGERLGQSMLEKIKNNKIAEHALGIFIQNRFTGEKKRNPLLQNAFETYMKRVAGDAYNPPTIQTEA